MPEHTTETVANTNVGKYDSWITERIAEVAKLISASGVNPELFILKNYGGVVYYIQRSDTKKLLVLQEDGNFAVILYDTDFPSGVPFSQVSPDEQGVARALFATNEAEKLIGIHFNYRVTDVYYYENLKDAFADLMNNV